jgi:hypothetical protein
VVRLDWGEMMMILDLHRQGVAVAAIARRSQLDPRPSANTLPVGWSRRSMDRGRPGRCAWTRSCANCARSANWATAAVTVFLLEIRPPRRLGFEQRFDPDRAAGAGGLRAVPQHVHRRTRHRAP